MNAITLPGHPHGGGAHPHPRQVRPVQPAPGPAPGRPARAGRPGAPGAGGRAGRHRREALPRQAALALDLPPGRNRLRPHVQHRPPLAGEAGRALRHRPPRRGHRANQRGRHPQVAVPLPRRPGGRDRLYPRPPRGPRRRVHLKPGRLHPVLPLLPHRHAGPGPQPRRPRDRRPVHGRPRRLRRMAQPPRRDPPPAVHHRPDGHGRAAVQLRERRQGHADRHGRRGHRPVPPPHHAVHVRRRPHDGPLRRGTRREPRRLPARRPRRPARPRSCR